MFNNRKERNELLEELVVPDEEAMDTNYSQMIYMLWGDDDISSRPCQDNENVQLGEKATLDWVKNAGHLVPLEKSFAYNERLKCFLERVTKD
ncbi:hypothetical protein CTI12_AA141250 [Artemisia annua]|uniref:Uncharacterized protein n=1 Tax=Artemisia annua TaxID=35608 RepID=A0A2U1PKR6_ARTAN|nr:hypothetical protein CTI12_AA141250 [Artemisia annua]